jgi:hypothetical protein
VSRTQSSAGRSAGSEIIGPPRVPAVEIALVRERAPGARAIDLPSFPPIVAAAPPNKRTSTMMMTMIVVVLIIASSLYSVEYPYQSRILADRVVINTSRRL